MLGSGSGRSGKRRSLLGTPRVVFLVLAGVILTLLINWRQTLINVPRVRVGPLERVEKLDKLNLRFFVLGDTGTGNDNQWQVAKAMEERCRSAPPDAIVLLGDNFYQTGVSSAEDKQWQSKLLAPYSSPCLAAIPFYPVLGNHDYKDNPSAQIEFSLLNPRWRMPNRFYTVKFGNLLRLVAYDSEVSELCLRPLYCSLDFLLTNAKRGDTTWTLVSGHHPLASSSDHGYGHSGSLRGLLLTPLLCQHVDFYLAGHAHHLEHRQIEGCRMELLISGAGGANLYGYEPGQEGVRFVASQYGFAELEVDAARLTSRFVGTDGKILHEAVKQRQP